MNSKIISVLALCAPLLGACGGSSNGDGPMTETRPCPASLDYGTVFTGGGGDGELVKLQLDTTKMTWQISYIQSPIPATTGTVAPTRAGQVAGGSLPPEKRLPTNKLNQCAFRLNGASLDASRPARIFVGEGVVVVGAGVQRGPCVQHHRALGARCVGHVYPAEDDVVGHHQGGRWDGAWRVEGGSGRKPDHFLPGRVV
ncbi:hypothetical protein OKW40_003121 [Paraburkholderia sp. RAU6.4a]